MDLCNPNYGIFILGIVAHKVLCIGTTLDKVLFQ